MLRDKKSATRPSGIGSSNGLPDARSLLEKPTMIANVQVASPLPLATCETAGRRGLGRRGRVLLTQRQLAFQVRDLLLGVVQLTP